MASLNHDHSSLSSQHAQNSQYHDLQLLIVSGRSGSGKTSVLNTLEDLGFYCIDNMPLMLIPDAIDKLVADGGIKKVALSVDIRTPAKDLEKFADIYEQLLEQYGHNIVKILYVTAREAVLVARFDATRRVHPLMPNISNLPAAIKKEIELLEPIASRADIKIDTSDLNIHQLKERLKEHLGVDNQIVVNILSFGFKYGVPIDVDFVFDVRILPNPHWQAELRVKTGLDDEVVAFFAKHDDVEDMLNDIGQFLIRWLPEFVHNNRHTVTIAIGCTGGKHRSVFIAQSLQQRLTTSLPNSIKVNAKHREKHRW